MPFGVPLDRQPNKGKTPADSALWTGPTVTELHGQCGPIPNQDFCCGCVVWCLCLLVLRGALQKMGMASCWLEIPTLTHLQSI